MATGTPSPTPSEDNRRNTGEIAVTNALDKVMTNPVQSYDEFLNSFTYLKQGMQKKKESNQTGTPSISSMLRQQRTSPSSNNKTITEKTEKTNTDSVKVFPASEEIEEEILCDGDVTSRISQTKMIKTGTTVKVDNYVDDIEDCDIEEFANGSYMASFSTDKPTSETVREPIHVEFLPSSNADIQPPNDSDTLSDMCQSMTLDENSTDKLLLNFLADLQNELNDNTISPNSSGDPPSVAAQSTGNSANDIQDFLQRSKPKKLTKTKIAISADDYVENDDDSGSDIDDAMDLLCDDSESNNVKVTINKQDLSNEIEETQKVNKKAKLDEIYRSALMDSEGVMRTHCEMEDSDPAPEVVDVKDLVFPGQVEETDDVPVYENETLLDFTATYRTEEQSLEVSNEDSCTDTIQPFTLDEDFDYDNIVLSPKFSTGDLKAMRGLQTPQTVAS